MAHAADARRAPGELTRRYIAGERARFVSPLALFLFSVFLMFAVLHSGHGSEGDALTPSERNDRIERLEHAIADHKKTLAAARAVPAPRRPQGRVASLTFDLSVEQARLDALKSGRPAVALDLTGLPSTGWHALDKGIAKANANPNLAAYKLQSSAYKYSWTLIPISTPLVALLFVWRRRYKLYDHAIFVTYSLAFMTMLVVLTNLVSGGGLLGGSLVSMLGLVPPVHMFFQLRGAYALRKRSALWRAALLSVFACAALVLFVVLLLVLGLLD